MLQAAVTLVLGLIGDPVATGSLASIVVGLALTHPAIPPQACEDACNACKLCSELCDTDASCEDCNASCKHCDKSPCPLPPPFLGSP